MNNLGVIDQFTNVFSQYIDSGFGLLSGEVHFLTATLVAIDITLAGLFWAMGGTEDVIARLIKKTLYIGAFAFIITNFASLASILLRSFAGLGLVASGSTLTAANLLRPGQLAAVGVSAGHPILTQMSDLVGFPDLFTNFDTLAVLGLAWLIVILSFFILAVQLFVTLIEFKLTTLAGFVLVPFALWGKTAFLAERVLGNVVSAGIKILVLAVIVGIGTTLFGQFTVSAGQTLTIDNALATMLAALALLGLGIYGPGIATGLVSGAPQLGAGAAAGTMLVGGGVAVAAGAAVVGAGVGGYRLARGIGSVARAQGARMLGAGAMAGRASGDAAAGGGTQARASGAPTWAQRLRSKFSQGSGTAARSVRSADRPATGPHPDLTDKKDE
ncbi:MAG: P-type conjugative transfer protein TrbL [Steroidobacteraceae bacterium]